MSRLAAARRWWQSVRRPRSTAPADLAVMARWQASMFFVGALLGGVALPWLAVAGLDVSALVALGAFAVVLGLARLVLPADGPPTLYEAIGGTGTALTAATIAIAGQTALGFVTYFVWVVIYFGYFFRPAAVISQLAWMALCLALALRASGVDAAAFATWLVTVGGLVLVTATILHLRGRMDALLAQLGAAANSDALTGLLNRRGFEEALARETARLRRDGGALALVIADVDNFKELNDRLGHLAGDEALARVARLMAARCRRVDAIARLGGDEFAVVAPGASLDEALALAERMRSAVRETFHADRVPLTVSLGVSVVDARGSALDLHASSDRAMYAAKAHGGDKTARWSHAPNGAPTEPVLV